MAVSHIMIDEKLFIWNLCISAYRIKSVMNTRTIKIPRIQVEYQDFSYIWGYSASKALSSAS